MIHKLIQTNPNIKALIEKDQTRSGHAFTLIEVVIMVVVLALAVPPTLELLMSTSASRVNVINTSRATMLATSVLEGVLADVASSDENLGFDALEDSGLYLNTANTGFYDRMSPVTQLYTDMGLTYEVVVGALVSSNGLVSAESNDNVFRTIEVRVQYPSADGASYILPVSLLVTDL
ncbi:MAG: hypothetical protein AB8C13_03695 [Phycisphaerales bacterium]